MPEDKTGKNTSRSIFVHQLIQNDERRIEQQNEIVIGGCVCTVSDSVAHTRTFCHFGFNTTPERFTSPVTVAAANFHFEYNYRAIICNDCFWFFPLDLHFRLRQCKFCTSQTNWFLCSAFVCITFEFHFEFFFLLSKLITKINKTEICRTSRWTSVLHNCIPLIGRSHNDDVSPSQTRHIIIMAPKSNIYK